MVGSYIDFRCWQSWVKSLVVNFCLSPYLRSIPQEVFWWSTFIQSKPFARWATGTWTWWRIFSFQEGSLECRAVFHQRFSIFATWWSIIHRFLTATRMMLFSSSMPKAHFVCLPGCLGFRIPAVAYPTSSFILSSSCSWSLGLISGELLFVHGGGILRRHAPRR